MFVVDDAAAAIRNYAQDGFDIVIAHGSQYGGSLQQIAPDFPEGRLRLGYGCRHVRPAERHRVLRSVR